MNDESGVKLRRLDVAKVAGDESFFVLGRAVSRNKCNSQLIFLSMLITKLGIPASETSLPLGV